MPVETTRMMARTGVREKLLSGRFLKESEEERERQMKRCHQQVHHVRALLENTQPQAKGADPVRSTQILEIRELRQLLQRSSHLLQMKYLTRGAKRPLTVEFVHLVEQLSHKCIQAVRNAQIDLFTELDQTLSELSESFKSLENDPYPFSDKYLSDVEASYKIAQKLLRRFSLERSRPSNLIGSSNVVRNNL